MIQQFTSTYIPERIEGRALKRNSYAMFIATSSTVVPVDNRYSRELEWTKLTPSAISVCPMAAFFGIAIGLKMRCHCFLGAFPSHGRVWHQRSDIYRLC
jgi:hypothetical protein